MELKSISKYINRIIAIVVFVIMAFALSENFIYSAPDVECSLQVTGVNDLETATEDEYVKYTVTGADPYILLTGSDVRLSELLLEVSEDSKDSFFIQVFYAANNEGLSESNSVSRDVTPDNGEVICDIPDGTYSMLRIDFDTDLAIKEVQGRGFSHMNYLFLVIYILICVLIVGVMWRYVDTVFGAITGVVDRIYIGITAKGIRCWHVFAILAITLGIIYSIIIPPLQVPDEQAHLGFIEQELGMTGISQKVAEYYGNSGMNELPRIYTNKVDRELFDDHRLDRFDKSLIYRVSAPSVLIVRHLPSAIGLCLGILIDLPIYYCLTLAEIFALLFYVLICYFALKIMPVKREAFMAIMLFPMAIQQCASLNYDATVIPISFLLLAICFDCIFGSRKVNWKTVIQLLIIMAIIAIIKIPYILILLVLFLVPRKKWELKIGKYDIVDIVCRFWPLSILLSIVVIALGLYLFRNNFFVKIMIACGYNFRHYLSIIFNTLKTNGKFYVLSTVGVFGWLDTPMPTMFFCLVGIFMLILSMQDDNGESICKIKWYHRGVCFLVFCLMTVFLITALLSWNFTLNGLDVYLLSLDDFVKGIQGISVALGIQGRYFIPMVFFLTIPLHGIINIKKSYLMILQFMYYSVMSIWTINILLQRFWY